MKIDFSSKIAFCRDGFESDVHDLLFGHLVVLASGIRYPHPRVFRRPVLHMRLVHQTFGLVRSTVSIPTLVAFIGIHIPTDPIAIPVSGDCRMQFPEYTERINPRLRVWWVSHPDRSI